MADRIPSANDITAWLNSANAILRRMESKGLEVEEARKRLDALRRGIVIKGEVVDPVEWEKKETAEKSRIGGVLRQLLKDMRRANRAEILLGTGVFGAVLTLLVALAILYGVQHRPSKDCAADDRAISRTLQAIHEVDFRISDFKTSEQGADADKKKAEAKSALNQAIEDLDKLLFPTTGAAPGGSEQAAPWACTSFSFATLSLWSEVRADASTEQLGKTRKFENFRKAIEPELESLRMNFLWTQVPGRWWELAYWAEFGTLVGILFYVAGLLTLGTFHGEDWQMFIAEIVITPFVVLVLFFLFGFTGITDFKPNESSITANVGFAFILGFAIRRTVGLLDMLKKRFFPDPAPAGK